MNEVQVYRKTIANQYIGYLAHSKDQKPHNI